MTHTPTNVILSGYETDLINTREALFMELEEISSEFANEARHILSEKIESNHAKPLLGEIFPWLIQDLVRGDINTTKKISVGWLAIYLYTLFIDEYIDNPKPLDSTRFIAASLLAKMGLIKLSKHTNNSKYEKHFDDAFVKSAYYQNLDVKFQRQVTSIEFKESYSEGKNYILLACAGAIASENSKHGDLIIAVTKSMLLAFQYLDDLADYKDDFNLKNITYLLNDFFKTKQLNDRGYESIKKEELLSQLISSGSLERVVDKVEKLLIQSLILINQVNNESNESYAAQFLSELYLNIGSFNVFLKEKCFLFELKSKEEQNALLAQTEKHIYIVSQST